VTSKPDRGLSGLLDGVTLAIDAAACR